MDNKKVELGDGEPSPPPELKRENFDLMCGACKLRLGNHLGYECPGRRGTFFELESGAAQEVSPPATGTSSYPRTGYLTQEVSPPSPDFLQWLKNNGHAAGSLELRSSKWWIDRVNEFRGGDTRELKAALRELWKHIEWVRDHGKIRIEQTRDSVEGNAFNQGRTDAAESILAFGEKELGIERLLGEPTKEPQ